MKIVFATLLVFATFVSPFAPEGGGSDQEIVIQGKSWYSKARMVIGPRGINGPRSLNRREVMTGPDVGTTVFDLVISLYNEPSGDDDPDNDTGTEEQTDYEEIIRFWADAVCEQSNGAVMLGKVRIFQNGIFGSLADVVWNASEWPRASVSGFGRAGRSITFGDEFPGGCGTGCDIDFLGTAGRREDAGYTLGHEFGHYILGLYDEYVGSDPAETRINFPQTGDNAVSPSIMNSQWNATTATGKTSRGSTILRRTTTRPRRPRGACTGPAVGKS